MTTPVSALPNLGPESEKSFARAGIRSAEELRALGADKAYAALLAHGTRPHFIGYYALVMGLQGRPWNDCRGEEKTRLRHRFDAIVKASDTEGDRMERLLDELGIRHGGKEG